MGADHLRKVAGYDSHDLRRKYDVRIMWAIMATITEPVSGEGAWLVFTC